MILHRHCICGSGGVSSVGAGVGLVVGSFVVHSLCVSGGDSGSGRGGPCTCGVHSYLGGVEILLHSAIRMSDPSFYAYLRQS